MAIRPPRRPRKRRRPNQIRDLVVTALVAAVVVIFLLRSLMAIVDIEQWTIAWRLVALPTDPIVSLLERVEAFQRTLVGHFSVSDAIAAMIAGLFALFMLASLAVRRSP